MPEESRFFDYVLEDGVPDRQYSADEFAEYFRQLISDGVFNGGDNLKVEHVEGRKVKILPGYAWIEGYMYRLTDDLEFELEIGDVEHDRIDRIVLRLDTSEEERTIKANLLEGTPAAEPEAPALTREGDIYELALADITVATEAVSIDQNDIEDRRLDEELCGLVNSLITVDTQQFQDEWDTFANDKFRTTESEYPQEWDDWWYGESGPDAMEAEWQAWKDSENGIMGMEQQWSDWWSGNDGPKGEEGMEAEWQAWFDSIEEGTYVTYEDFNSHKSDNTPHQEIASVERKGKDEEGIFTKIEWKRGDGTLFKVSELQGDSPEYDTRTITFYEEDGETVKEEFTLDLSYDEEGNIVSEVIQQ